MRALAPLALLLAASLPAAAQLRQPTGAEIPSEPGCHAGRPTGLLATFACVCT